MGEPAAHGHRHQGFELTPAVTLRVAAVSDVVAQADPQAAAWMDAQESERLAAMGSAQRRRQFITGHWLARVLAAENTGTRPGDWLLTATSLGAPKLIRRSDGEDPGIHVSLSHSGQVVAAAVGSCPLGIDVESTGKVRDWTALADLVFAPAECEQLRSSPTDERRALFHRYWTLTEASGKRDGVGLQPRSNPALPIRECNASEADAITWQSEDYCLALVGEMRMLIDAQGVSAVAQQRFWRIGA